MGRPGQLRLRRRSQPARPAARRGRRGGRVRAAGWLHRAGRPAVPDRRRGAVHRPGPVPPGTVAARPRRAHPRRRQPRPRTDPRPRRRRRRRHADHRPGPAAGPRHGHRHPFPDPRSRLLLRPDGTRTRPGRRRRGLARWAASRLHLPSIDYRWSAQDNTTVDRLPYIGRYTRASRHLWVATGFGQWGMTNGTLAGLLLRDLITGVDNPWAALFDPARPWLRHGAGAFVRDNATVAKHFLGDRLRAARAGGPEDLAPGQAAVCTVGGHLTALRRDHDGQLTALSARCTHLGCAVAFNDAEQTWDCPCHGSRYAVDGTVIQGPATEPLQPLSLPRAPSA